VCKNGPKGTHPKNQSTALPVRECVAPKHIAVLQQPAYSPDLAPSDFFLFPKVKDILKGRHFDGIDDNGSPKGHSTKPFPKLF
jgi:hypothetical protein